MRRYNRWPNGGRNDGFTFICSGYCRYCCSPVFIRGCSSKAGACPTRFASASIGRRAMGRSVSQMSIPKNSKGEYRLRTIGGDFLLNKNSVEANAATIIATAIEPPMTSAVVRVKLTIDADSRASNCEVLESDAPKQLQDKTCEILRQKGKFSVSSTTIEQTVRFKLSAE